MSEHTPVYSTTKAPGEIKFMGYGNPKYTGIPDLFLDEQMQDLTEAELKVMLYIFRRTFGFKKEQDTISYDQFLNGIKARDGRQLDHGTGISETSLTTALKKLVERSYIFKHNQFATNGAKRTTIYELNIDGQPHLNQEPPSPNFGDTPSPKFTPTHPQNLGDPLRLNPSPKFGDTRKQFKQKTEKGSIPNLTKNSEEPEPTPAEFKPADPEDLTEALIEYARRNNYL